MRRKIRLLVFSVILMLGVSIRSEAQVRINAIYNIELNEPTHSGIFATPPYSTWRTVFYAGAGVDVPLSGFVSIFLSLDYARRSFNSYTHPLSIGNSDYSSIPPFGGSGSLFRCSLGPAIKLGITDAIDFSVQAGATLTQQSYDHVYYYYTGPNTDPNAPPYTISEVNDPSSAFLGLSGRISVNYALAGRYGVILVCRALQNEQAGFHWLASGGVYVDL